MNLNNKIVVVTGGSGLLGSSFIKAIEDKNGTAICADISTDSEYQLDITDERSIEDLIKKIHSKYGKIDALINNAYPRNKQYGRDFFDVKYSDFCKNLGSNLGGYFLCSQKFSEYFIKQGHGNIINISSIYGVNAPKFDIYDSSSMTMPVEYAAIKAGLIHLTKYMASYLKGKNIRVNTISPGGILDKQPESFLSAYQDNCLSKGMLNPQDLSGALIFLLCDESKYMNGQNLIIDDGFTL